MKKNMKIWGGVVAAILLIVVILQNIEAVSTRLLFVTIKMPRAALLFIAVAIGFLLGQVFTFDMNLRD